MEITYLKEFTATIVETDEPEYSRYTRYTSDNWTVVMGESEEPVYDCTELERLYQSKILENTRARDSIFLNPY